MKTNRVVPPRARMLHVLADQVDAAHKAVVERYRPMYMAELETFAETLRAGFEAGQLYGYREKGPDGHDDYSGERRLEMAIDSFFGLEVTRGGSDPKTWTGDEHAARAILALSPSVELMENGGLSVAEYNHAGYAARDAVLYDLLTLARSRRWYRPSKDEAPEFLRRQGRRAA